jgi:dienelactone hydrolase
MEVSMKTILRTLPAALLLAGLPGVEALAKVETKAIEYRHGDLLLEGHLAWDDAIQGRRPAVLVIHEWWGLNDYARRRAEMLAEMGYLAFALDMYGKGKTTQHPQEAGQWAAEIRKNVDEWRRRAEAGLKVLQEHQLADRGRTAAIGYCFGGSTVLQLAYGGAPLKGVVSFHGSLPAPPAGQEVRPKILVCHGAEDSFIPDEQIKSFQEGLRRARADWQMVYYGGARHSFTNPDAGKAGIDGLRYDKDADRRSWAHLGVFLRELFES